MAEEIVTIGGDTIGLIDSLAQVVSAVDDVRLALESLGAGGTSLQDVISAIQGIGESAGSAASEMGSLAASTEEAAASSEGLRGSMEGLTGTLGETIGRATELAGALLEFQAIFGLIEGVQHFVGDMLGMNEQFQSLTITLKNFVGAQKAADLVNWITAFGQRVPFTTEAVMQAVVAVTALGDNAKQVVPMLATLAAQMGVSLPTATQALQDAQNGLWRMMERDLHINREELVKFGLEVDKKGHVLNNTLLPALERFAQAKFPTALSDRMASFGGLIQESTDLIQLFAKALGQPLFDLAQQGLGKVVAWAQDPATQQGLQQLGTIAGGALADGFKTFFNIISAVIQVIQGGIGWFQQMSGDVKQVVGPVDQLAGASKTVAGRISGFATAAGNLKQPLKDMQGPFAPIVGMFRDLAGAIQAVIGWFEPTAASSKKVSVGMREWVQTGDGVGHWKSKVVTSLMDIPGQASGFMQFLKSLGDAFSKAFNDPKGIKLHQLATDLKELTDAFIGLGQWLAGTGGQILRDAATVLGSIASSIADATSNLQQMFPNLNIFQGILQLIVDYYLAKLLVQTLALGLQGVNNLIQFGKAGVQWVGSVRDTMQSLGDKIGTVVDWLKNKFSPAAEEAGSKASTSAGEVDALATAEGDVVTKAEGSAAVEDLATAEGHVGQQADAAAVEDLATAEQAAGDKAATAAPELDTFAAAEQGVGTSAEEAAGGTGVSSAAGAASLGAGGVLGLVGALFLLAQWLNDNQQPIKDFTNSVFNMLGITINSEQNMRDLIGMFPSLAPMLNPIIQKMDEMNSSVYAGIQLWLQLENIWTNLKPPDAGPLPPYHPGGGGHGGGHPHAAGGTVGANEAWQIVSEDGLELALLGPGAAKLPTGSRIFTAAQTAPFLPYLEGGPMIGGVPLGAYGGGMLGGGLLGGGNTEMLLQQIRNSLQGIERALPLGAAPVSATTGSFMQQFNGANFNMYGIQNLASLQAELNMLNGLVIEYAQRGAISG